LAPKGIGSHFLLEEVAPGVDPLGPKNKLFFSCGPLSGSAMPGTNRYAVYFLSPQTGGHGLASMRRDYYETRGWGEPSAGAGTSTERQAGDESGC